MASIVEKRLVRRIAGVPRAVPNVGRSAALEAVQAEDRTPRRHVNLVEVDRLQGALIDPRLGGSPSASGGIGGGRRSPTCDRARGHATRSTSALTLCPTFGSHADREARSDGACALGSRAWDRPTASNLAPATMHRVVQILNKCIIAAFEDRLIQHNPVAKLPLPEDRAPRDALPDLRRTVDASPTRIDPPLPRVRVARRIRRPAARRDARAALGSRRSLRRRVQVAETLVDIDGQIHFGPPKTKAAVRSVPLPRFVADELARSPATWPRTGSCSSRPRACRFEPRCSVGASGRRQSRPPAWLRYAFTICGTPPCRCGSPTARTRSRSPSMAGHTSVSVVLDRYGHLYPQQDDELMERLERRIARGAG